MSAARAKYAEPDLPKAMAMIEAATREGRHGPSKFVCNGCRQWVDAIYYVTEDGRRLCKECDPTKDRK